MERTRAVPERGVDAEDVGEHLGGRFRDRRMMGYDPGLQRDSKDEGRHTDPHRDRRRHRRARRRGTPGDTHGDEQCHQNAQPPWVRVESPLPGAPVGQRDQQSGPRQRPGRLVHIQGLHHAQPERSVFLRHFDSFLFGVHVPLACVPGTARDSLLAGVAHSSRMRPI